MNSIDPTKLLNYGAIGLGFLLAYLSFRLLSKEQQIVNPRPAMLKAVYMFMTFSFLLSLFGFGTEIFKNKNESKSETESKFSQLKPILRTPKAGSLHHNFPRDLEVSWEPISGATYYKIEIEAQMVAADGNGLIWVALEPQNVSVNNAQIHFGADNWGRWRIIGINSQGMLSQPSDWWTFKYSTKLDQ